MKAAKTRDKPEPAWRIELRARRVAGVPPLRRRVLFGNPLLRHLADRALAALWPWRAWEYPGNGLLRAWLMGVDDPQTADAYRAKLPISRALVMASKLESKALELWAVASELRAYAGDGPNHQTLTKASSQEKVNAAPVAVPPPE